MMCDSLRPSVVLVSSGFSSWVFFFFFLAADCFFSNGLFPFCHAGVKSGASNRLSGGGATGVEKMEMSGVIVCEEELVVVIQ